MYARPKPKSKHIFKRINIWVILAAFVVACTLLVISLILLWLTRPAASTTIASTAELIIIEAPTATPQPITATVNPETAQAPSEGTPGYSGDDLIVVGARVQIYGTSGDGLRFRDEPGLQGDVLLVADEAEIFVVEEGPVVQDDYTWWYLVGLYDETRLGWAVSDYLSIVQNP